MAHSGLGYYYNKASLSSGDLNCWFNFNYSGDPRSELGSGQLIFHGSTGQIWSSIGSGFFSGQAATISGNNVIGDELTAILLYSKNITGNCVLFSSLESGSSASGFSVCLNDSNKVQIAAYDNEKSGLVVNTYPIQLSRSNGLIISKADNIFTLGKFNFAQKEITYSTHVFPDGCNTSSNNITLASGTWFPSSTNFRTFTGHIDEFVLINKSLGEESILELFKSFYNYEPISSFSIISENDSYSYSNLNTITNPVWEEMQSGAFDYINSNIFNKTGIGTIRVISSGTIISGTAYVSGNLSGQVSLQTGYYQSITGSGVTGFSSSGLVPSASGITGYVDINLFPITVFNSGDIYQLSAQSGLIGPTDWVSQFTDPLYGTIVTQELVSGSQPSIISNNFSFTITGLSGNAAYTHIADYTNNGSDNIVIAHDLSYSSLSGSFRAFKTTQILYAAQMVESGEDINFKNLFRYDGAILIDPIQSGDILDSYTFSSTGSSKINNTLYKDFVSGLFFTDMEDLTSPRDSLFYYNGVYQNKNEDLTGVFSGQGYSMQSNFFNSYVQVDREDIGIIDVNSNINTVLKISSNNSIISGNTLFSGLISSRDALNKLVFLNGLKLCPLVDYNYFSNNSGSIRWANNDFSGVSGILTLVSNSGSGDFSLSRGGHTHDNSITGAINENQSLLFLNRLKQEIGVDYLEISSLDLIYGLTGFYESNLEEIFI